jgi:hypothetical protein
MLMSHNDTPPLVEDERGPRTSMPRVIQPARRTGEYVTSYEPRMLRASDSDRDRVAELLNVAFSEGRLSKDEYDSRLESAFSARTYADLDQIVADLPAALPAAQATAATPVARVNGLAVASLACALAQFVAGPLATIPAIVLGHMARHQIKRSGEQGAGLALAGLIIGWAAMILGILLIVGAAVAAGMHGTMPAH